MIRSIAQHADGKPVVLLGLVTEDLERVVGRDDPIIVDLSHLVPNQTVALPEITVAIFFATAETVEQMRAQLGEIHVATEAPKRPEGDPRNDYDSSNGDGADRQPRTRADAREQRRRRRGW